MSDVVQQVKDKLSILDVVSPYVELHKAGKNFKGKSPFSVEKTPSFYVSPDRGMYYCFSTSQGGDIFSFVQAMEGVEFKEALRILAEKAGVALIPEKPEQKTERDRTYAVIGAAVEFYIEALAESPAATAYVEKRGVIPATLNKWQIGYAPGPPQHGWRALKDHLTKKDFTSIEQLRAGLIKTAENGKEPFDVFRDRIMFPMAESSGRVVAFSGRILHPDAKSPKYVNSPETILYKKSELLFGYDKAKEGIRRLDFSLIVEGQFDVVLAHQAGYSNAVAVSGTALTIQHVQQLERLSSRVVLALDADRAGIAAMKRAADVMLRRGLDVKVAELPEGKDPADIIQSDSSAFRKIIGGAVPVIEFFLHVVMRQYPDARTMKLKAREEVLPFVLLLPNRIDQEHFVSSIAASLATTTEAVRFELERLREQAEATGVARTEVPTIPQVSSVEHMVPAVDQIAAVAGYTQGAIAAVALPYHRPLQRIYDEVLALTRETITPSAEEIARATFTFQEHRTTASARQLLDEVVGLVNRLRRLIVQREIALLRERLQQAEAAGESVEEQRLLADISVYSQARVSVPYTAELIESQKD